MTELKVISLILVVVLVVGTATWLFLKGANDDDDDQGYGFWFKQTNTDNRVCVNNPYGAWLSGFFDLNRQGVHPYPKFKIV